MKRYKKTLFISVILSLLFCGVISFAEAAALPDLVVTSISNPPASAVAGSSFNVTAAVKNIGKAKAKKSVMSYYLSKDTRKSREDIFLADHRTVHALKSKKSSRGRSNATIWDTVPYGKYYLIACADCMEDVKESNEKNNCRASRTKIQIIIKLISIAVTPADPNITIGDSQQFTATGTYSDNTTKDMTASVTWSSSNNGVATINNAGLAASVSPGTTTITAAYGGKTGSTSLTVFAEAAQKINGDTSAYHNNPHAVFNKAGTGLAVWNQFNGKTNRILYSVYSAGVWSAEAEMAKNTDESFISSPELATNGTDFMVIYTQGYEIYAMSFSIKGIPSTAVKISSSYQYGFSIASNGSGYAVTWHGSDGNIYANIYSGGTWGTETILESGTGDAYSPCIASNGSGYAVTWQQDDGNGTYSIYASIYNGKGWDAEKLLENGTGNATQPSIASDGSSYAVTWQQDDGIGVYSIYASIYSGKGWDAETLLESGTGNAYSPRIASNGSGYAVTWQQYDGSPYSIYASIYNEKKGWEPETLLENGKGGSYEPRIASNGIGYYAVTWQQDDNGVPSIYANRYVGKEWDTATLLGSGTDNASYPYIASNGKGYAVTWQQPDNLGRSNIFASMYEGFWGANTELVKNSYEGSSDEPVLATNNSGTTLAVWGQYENGTISVYGRIRSGGSWADPFKISDSYATYRDLDVATDGNDFMVAFTACTLNLITVSSEGIPGTAVPMYDSACSFNPRIASNGSGYAVTWQQYNNGVPSAYANIYSGGTWGTETLLGSNTNFAFEPRIASNGSGYAVAWCQNDGSTYSIYANNYNGSAWGTATLLETGTGNAYGPRIASNSTGYAVTWYQDDGSAYSIYANIYSGGARGIPTLLENSTDSTFGPHIASNGSGYAVTWQQGDGSGVLSIYANIYSGGARGNPTLLESGTGSAYFPYIASNGSGYAVAWYQDDGSAYSIYANSYNGSVWGTESLIKANANTEYNTALSIEPHSGTYSFIWLQPSPQDQDVWDVWAKFGM